MTLTIHHLQVSQSERLVWLCEELNIDYKLEIHQRAPIFSPDSIKKLHPMLAAPIIVDSNVNPPLTLAESGACAEYIAVKYGKSQFILPPDHPNYADYLYWFHFSNSNLQPSIGQARTAHSLAAPSDPRGAVYDQRLHKVLLNINTRLLTTSAYLAGPDFTLADIMSVFSFTTMRKFDPKSFSLEGLEGVRAWLERCTDRKGYREAMRKGEAEVDGKDGKGKGGVDWRECVNVQPPPLFAPIKAVLEKKD